MKGTVNRRFYFVVIVTLFSLIIPAIVTPSATFGQDEQNYGTTDAMSFWFYPNLSVGESELDFMKVKKFRYMFRQARIIKSQPATYFAIQGANNGPEFPGFYGGLQELEPGKRVALFSAWDIGVSNCEYFKCKPEDADPENKIRLFRNGNGVTTKRFGGEGTGMQSFIYDLNWREGEVIQWLVSIEPYRSETLLSTAFKIGTNPWRFFATYILPTNYRTGLPGGYAFIEDFGIPTPFAERSMEIGPTIGISSQGKPHIFNNINVLSSEGKNRHFAKLIGSSIFGAVGTDTQISAPSFYSFRTNDPESLPNFIDGIRLLESVTSEISTRSLDELKEENINLLKQVFDMNSRQLKLENDIATLKQTIKSLRKVKRLFCKDQPSHQLC